MRNLFDLTGKVAIVTGGNGGIGLGMARGLASAGANIVVAGRNASKSAGAVEELEGLGVRASAVEVDVRSESSIKAMVAETVRLYGRLDILINNAGMAIRKPPQETSLDEFKQVVETNLTSAFLAGNAAYPEMKKAGGGKIVNIGSMLSIFGAPFAPGYASSKGGKIVNIGSMLSIFGAPFAPGYASSKGGIVQLTKVCATAWARDNIQVNAVLPGWIDTALTETAREQVPGLHEKVLARTPAERWGAPNDFSGIAVFLCSAASQFVTGTAIPVDGGYSVQI